MRLVRKLLTLVSALLLAAIVIVWIRSYWHSETFFRMEADRVQAIDRRCCG